MVKKIFIGNVPKDFDEDEFKDYFKKFGSVEDIVLMKRRGERLNRGFGFVKYEDAAVADEVVGQSHKLRSTTLTINYAKVPMEQDTQRYYVGDIDEDKITEKDLKTHFEKYGTVEDSFIMKGKGFGFVAIYNDDESTHRDIPSHRHVINEAKIRVEKAKARERRRQRPTSQRYPSDYYYSDRDRYSRRRDDSRRDMYYSDRDRYSRSLKFPPMPRYDPYDPYARRGRTYERDLYDPRCRSPPRRRSRRDYGRQYSPY